MKLVQSRRSLVDFACYACRNEIERCRTMSFLPVMILFMSVMSRVVVHLVRVFTAAFTSPIDAASVRYAFLFAENEIFSQILLSFVLHKIMI